jgi:hypothetical protein
MRPLGVDMGKKLPFRLTRVRNVEYFDGPLLVEYSTDDNETYLESWFSCDENAKIHRWLVFKVTQHDLFQYEWKKIGLLNLLKRARDGLMWVVDRSEGLIVYVGLVRKFDELPDDCLPSISSTNET